ncbi:MAG: hypothetical protein AB7N65_10675 [Vicinamibacterales bacterium]
MSPQTVRLLVATLVALGLALPFTTPEIAGIATWKIVLGIFGLFLYTSGGRRNADRPREGGTN